MRLIISSNLLRLCALCCVGTTVFAHQDEHAPAAPSQEASAAQRAPLIADAPVPAGVASEAGSWSALFEWPIIAVHASLLPNGKVLSWDATPDDADDDPHTTDNYTTRVTLWDPLANTHVATNNDTDTDLFCAGSAHLWDGRVLFAGGDGGRAGANGPLANSNIYNPVSNTWHRTENMNAPRWYSSVAALPNGEMLTLGGTYEPSPLAEVFRFDQTWRALEITEPAGSSEDYQWMQSTPEGSVILFGPQNSIVDITTSGDGQLTEQGDRDNTQMREYGSYAMYDVGKILVSGGGDAMNPAVPGATNSAVVIDTASRQATDTGNMTYLRRQHNLTILADGSVLATGGNSDGEQYVSMENPVLVPEIWSPATGQWRDMNPMQRSRQYHSIALLLPDGRVLSAGGGLCGDCYSLGYEEQNAEIFSPPYLFTDGNTPAERPRLGLVPAMANYAERLLVGVDDSSVIDRVHLVKLGSPTHSQNQDQRLVPLLFERSNRSLLLTMPASRDVAPPGHYMLFVVDVNGVPSVGEIVKVGQPLLQSGEGVVSTLEAGAFDVYSMNATAGQYSISIAAQSPVGLSASLAAPASSQIQDAQNLCSAGSSDAVNNGCVVSMSSPGVIYIGVDGAGRTDYRLQVERGGNPDTGISAPVVDSGSGTPTSNNTGDGSSVEGLPVANPLPSGESTGSVIVGGGAGGYLAVILLLLRIWRPSGSGWYTATRQNRKRIC